MTYDNTEEMLESEQYRRHVYRIITDLSAARDNILSGDVFFHDGMKEVLCANLEMIIATVEAKVRRSNFRPADPDADTVVKALENNGNACDPLGPEDEAVFDKYVEVERLRTQLEMAEKELAELKAKAEGEE